MTIPNADILSLAARTEMSNVVDLHGNKVGEIPNHPWIPDNFVSPYGEYDDAVWGDFGRVIPLRRLPSILVCPTWHAHICTYCGYGDGYGLASETDTYWTGAMVALRWEDLPDMQRWRRAKLPEIVCALAQNIGLGKISTGTREGMDFLNFRAFINGKGKIATECMRKDSDDRPANVLWIRTS